MGMLLAITTTSGTRTLALMRPAISTTLGMRTWAVFRLSIGATPATVLIFWQTRQYDALFLSFQSGHAHTRTCIYLPSN